MHSNNYDMKFVDSKMSGSTGGKPPKNNRQATPAQIAVAARNRRGTGRPTAGGGGRRSTRRRG